MILRSFLFVLTLLLLREVNSTETCIENMHEVSKIINSLGTRLEQQIGNKENYFISPLSISVALAMVYIGARGTTREQMSEALNLNIVGKNCLPNKISEGFRELIQSLENEGNGYSLLIANGAFLQVGYKISQFYSSNLGKFFNSNVKHLNFAQEETATMDAINEWVAKFTQGKIDKLLNEPLDPLTIMVLMNAVYYKGLWDLPFNESNTGNSFFYGTNDTTKVIPFMIMRDKFHYYFDPVKRYSYLELEYLGQNTSMILILPKDVAKFPEVTLTSEILCTLRNNFEFVTVTVMIPKFNMEFERELSKDMINLGMEELFSDRADLSGIREQNDLHVSLMIHKAVIEVNEKGTKASAFTGVGIDGRLNSNKKETFLADHPFLFYIVHKDTNTILFSGRMVDP